MCVGWRPGWGASGLPPLPWNYWWTEASGVLAEIQNQLQNTRVQTLKKNPDNLSLVLCLTGSPETTSELPTFTESTL